MVTRVTGAERLVHRYSMFSTGWKKGGESMNHCSAAIPDMLQHSSFLSCEKQVQCSVLPSLDQTFDSHQLPEVPFLAQFCCIHSQGRLPTGRQNLFPICCLSRREPEYLAGNFTGQEKKKKESKKKGLNHTIINREVIMPVWKLLI